MAEGEWVPEDTRVGQAPGTLGWGSGTEGSVGAGCGGEGGKGTWSAGCSVWAWCLDKGMTQPGGLKQRRKGRSEQPL